MKEQIKRGIKKIIIGNEKFDYDTKIFEQGLLDSMGLMLLIDFLNDEFGVETNDRDLIKENFESVNAIEKYILNRNSHENKRSKSRTKN